MLEYSSVACVIAPAKISHLPFDLDVDDSDTVRRCSTVQSYSVDVYVNKRSHEPVLYLVQFQ